MGKRFAIYGAGGFGREVRGILALTDTPFAGFVDDFQEHPEKVTGDQYDDIFLAIAQPGLRKKLFEKIQGKNFLFRPLISPGVQLHPSIKLNRGAILCRGVNLTVDIVIGEFVIVNLNSTIGHDVRIGAFTSIMPGVNISGNVSIGKGVLIGSGAIILQGRSIGDDAVIGAGAVVTHDVPAGVTVVGVPARPLKKA